MYCLQYELPVYKCSFWELFSSFAFSLWANNDALQQTDMYIFSHLFPQFPCMKSEFSFSFASLIHFIFLFYPPWFVPFCPLPWVIYPSFSLHPLLLAIPSLIAVVKQDVISPIFYAVFKLIMSPLSPRSFLSYPPPAPGVILGSVKIKPLFLPGSLYSTYTPKRKIIWSILTEKLHQTDKLLS